MEVVEKTVSRKQEVKSSLFNKPRQKAAGALGLAILKDKVAMSEQIERDTAAFLAAGKKIKELPSEQVPPKKRPAMQQYGGGGFFEL